MFLLNHTFLLKQPLFHCCGKVFIFPPFSVCPVVTETTGSVSGVSLTSELNEELNDLIQRFHNQLHDSQVSPEMALYKCCHYQFLFYLTMYLNVCIAHLCVFASEVIRVPPKLGNSANVKILKGYQLTDLYFVSHGFP